MVCISFKAIYLCMVCVCVFHSFYLFDIRFAVLSSIALSSLFLRCHLLIIICVVVVVVVFAVVGSVVVVDSSRPTIPRSFLPYFIGDLMSFDSLDIYHRFTLCHRSFTVLPPPSFVRFCRKRCRIHIKCKNIYKQFVAYTDTYNAFCSIYFHKFPLSISIVSHSHTTNSD